MESNFIDWDDLIHTSDDDDLLPKFSVIDVKLAAQSDLEITESIERLSKTLQLGADTLPDKGKKLKADLRRREDETERRRKLRGEYGELTKSEVLAMGRARAGLFYSQILKTSSADSKKRIISNDDNKAGDFNTKFSETTPNSLKDLPLRNPVRSYHVVDFNDDDHCSPEFVVIDAKLAAKSDLEIMESIERLSETLQLRADTLPDKGEKLKADIKRREAEIERRRISKVEKGKLTKSEVLDIGRARAGLFYSQHSKKRIISNDDNKDGDYFTNFSEPNSPQDLPLRNPVRSYHALQEFMADLDPCLKDVQVCYPSWDDPDAVEVNYYNMACLGPKAYISSTIMNFYIRYLQQPSSSSESAMCNYHIFSTYFYNKLEKLNYGKDSFLKFRKWWKGVSIFEKSYILLPVHENSHWSLVIICLPNKDDELGLLLLHLDSLGLHDSMPLFDNIKRFLKEEWCYLRESKSPVNLPVPNESLENLDSIVNHRTVMVPQQEHNYDCGLFVLHYMERFIKEAPERFRKEDLLMFSRQWFQPQEASNLRVKIYDLLVEQFKKVKKY